jgi:hypothetical protein
VYTSRVDHRGVTDSSKRQFLSHVPPKKLRFLFRSLKGLEAKTNVHRRFPALLFQSNECPKLNLPLRMARVSDAFHEPDAHHQTQTHQRLVYSFRIADKLQ